MPIKFLNSGLLEGSLQLTSYGGGSISGTGTYNLGVDASGNVIETSLIEGSGTTNYVVKWTPDGNTLGDSQIFDDGTNVGIGTDQPQRLFHIDSGNATAFFRFQGGGGFGRYTEIYNNDNDLEIRADATGGGTSSGTINFGIGSDDITTLYASGQVTFWQYGSGTFTGTAAKNLSITSTGSIIETDAVPSNVVETVTTTDGTYINLTPNSPTDGAVTVTADLSAVDGTSGANERYLTKTNKWAEISTIPGTYTWSVDGDQGTTYTVNSGNTVDFAGSTYITTSTTSNLGGPTLVITHDNTARNNTASSITPNFGSSFTAIDSITTNSTGHVTAVNTKTIGLGTPAWFADADAGSEDIQDGTTVTFLGGTGMDTSINSNFEITFTNTDRGSSQNIFKNFAVSGQSTVVADSNNDTLTLVAGSNVSLTTNATNDSITINATDTNTNNYVSSISFNTTNGVLTLNRSGLSSLTVDLDGRYLTGNQTITLTGDVTGSGTTSITTNVSADVIGASELKVTGNGTTSQFLRSDGDGTFSWATPTDTNTNNYVTSASFNTGNGVLTLNRSGLSAVTVDLDGRYLTSYTETDTLQSVTNRGASTTVRSIFTGGLNTNNSSTRDKISVYTGAPYIIGMQSGITYGHLNDWGMTFQFNNDSDRGFWWGDESHSTAQGAMSLTTNGRLTVATSLSVGQGESVTSASTVPLYVAGTAVIENTSAQPKLTIGDIDNANNSQSGATLEIGNRATNGVLGSSTIDLINGSFSQGSIQFRHGQATIGGDIADPRAMISSSYTGSSTDYNFQLAHYSGSTVDNYTSMRADHTYFNKEIRIGGATSANGLDDYEEGIWTVSFAYANTGTVTNYAVSSFGSYTWTGKYVKIGRLVHCTFYFGCNTFPWPVNTSSQVFMNESSFPFAMESTTKAVNGSFYSFPGLSSSGTSAVEVSGTLYPIGYANSFGAAFVADRGYYSNFESADTDAFNAGPGTPSFYMRGSFQYYTDS